MLVLLPRPCIEPPRTSAELTCHVSRSFYDIGCPRDRLTSGAIRRLDPRGRGLFEQAGTR